MFILFIDVRPVNLNCYNQCDQQRPNTLIYFNRYRFTQFYNNIIDLIIIFNNNNNNL